MSKNAITRRALLDRWRGIGEADDEDHIDPSHQRCLLRQLKEEWFSDAFNFLIGLPCNQHIWCSSWDLMGPLLETFYNYFKDESYDSPLKVLWTRVSNEMRQCTQCICQHHQAQETYNTEYEPSSIGPLLEVLHTLDEERVSRHLKEINVSIAQGQIDARDNAEVVCLMFEVLMFPYLLEDQLLTIEFETFIQAVDNSHELALAGHQQYPGVYALLFLKSRRVRSIGFRLAGHMGRLREILSSGLFFPERNLRIFHYVRMGQASVTSGCEVSLQEIDKLFIIGGDASQYNPCRKSMDLEPLQPLLKKCIGFLETDMMPLVADLSRPRVQMDRITVWLGIKALLGFLEPPAFEEGILDRYPVFLSIVLNHISDDSAEFSYAVNCLRLLFEMLGCKLWLRSTLSASVMRNTMLGQCFHTQNEKSHKEIFDLFLPFLQSLEALQDGEHEKQRTHLLYFLLHQVPVSSNFSTLMQKKACQIALLIVYRGYKINPPCPPYECAHMWGPSLVSSLRDSSLHNSLRQPAFDLIQIIITSDASALMASILKSHLSNDRVIPISLGDEDKKMLFDLDVEETDISCWSQYHLQSQIISLVYEGWMCIPMLWFDVLVGTDPLILPPSFCKAVFWAMSRFSMVALENIATIDPSVENWLKNFASELSHLFGWKTPSGSDDGGDGIVSKNSIVVSKMCMPLVRTFRRFASHYIARMERGELIKQWKWEPMMADSLILLLSDPSENGRQVSKSILQQFSNGQSLTHGLQFLCSSQSSLAGIFFGLRHALKLVQLDSVLENFQMLHHFFFVLCKLMKEGYPSTISIGGNSSEILNMSQFSSQGGFLRQPAFDTGVDNLRTVVSLRIWEKFCCLISETAWSSVEKCLEKGKAFKDHKISQMTCIRLLEILPVLAERLFMNSGVIIKSISDLSWLQDLMDWGGSSLPVVFRYWKQALTSLLSLLKKSCGKISAFTIKAIENLLSSDNVAMVELRELVARLSVSLMDEGYVTVQEKTMESKSLATAETSHDRICSVEDIDLLLLKEATELPFSGKNCHKKPTDVILLSDDEKEPKTLAAEEIQSHIRLSQHKLDAEVISADAIDSILHSSHDSEPHAKTISTKNPLEAVLAGSSQDFVHLPLQKLDSDTSGEKLVPASRVESDAVDNKETEELSAKHSVQDSHIPQNLSDIMLSGETICLRTTDTSSISQPGSDMKLLSDENTKFKSDAHKRIEKVIPRSVGATNEAVRDKEEDLWDFSFFKSARQDKSFSKPVDFVPKRQVIKLNLPVENRSGNGRFGGQVKRFKAPRLDDWYKQILELDYFATVGLRSADTTGNKVDRKLKEVPICFESPDEYGEVFQPLVLEEFKAQLSSSFQEMVSIEEMCYGTLSVLSVERVDDFHILRCVHDDADSGGSRSCLEHDLVLLTRKPLLCSSTDIHMVGKVERREIDNKRKLNILVIRVYLQNGCSRLNQARKFLVERSKWCISHLLSITPQLREFQALSSIKEIPLLPVILNPKIHPYDCHSSAMEDLGKLSQPLQQVLQSSYNDSQLQAISSAIGLVGLKRDFELSLIQGPPGTGKTQTIVAIVSVLLAFSRLRDDKKSSNDYLKSSTLPQKHSRLKINQSAAMARAWQDAALARQLNEDAERNTTLMSSRSRGGRILICAQSNAAVDELVSRISTGGLYGSNGLKYKPYLVRVGNARTIHPNSLPFFIDTLVDQRLSEERGKGGKNDCGDKISSLRSNLESLTAQIRFYEVKRVNLRDGNSDAAKRLLQGEVVKGCEIEELSDAELEAKLRRLYEKKKVVYTDLSNAQAQERKASEESRALKHKLRRTILKEAEIVVTTLSGSGGDLYAVCAESISSHKFSSSSESTLFDAVVIDEAAQALEPATLIPLQLLKSQGTRCIMVGDPKQLPATVLSNVASKYLFQCSMFERLQRAGHPVIMLNQQYRMHPDICRFPALHFYDGKLKNGYDKPRKSAVFHETDALGPYVFFDIVDGRESRGKNSSALSLYNEFEAEAAVEVLKLFKKKYPLEFVGGRIGVVTPYRSQLYLLRSRFAQAFGSSLMAEMEFNTVDGFQGREVDILVLSTVRASEQYTSINSIGFVADVRRMNVALTRAKLSLWIIGNARTLQANDNWAALLKDAEERGLVTPVTRPYSSTFKTKFNKDPAVESSGNHFKQLQHVEKIKAINGQADVPKKHGKDTYDRRIMVNKTRVDAMTGKNEHNPLAIKDAFSKNKRVIDVRNTLPTNDAACAFADNNKSQNSRCLKSSVKEVSKNGSASKNTGDKLIKIPKSVHGDNSNENLRCNSEKLKNVEKVEARQPTICTKRRSSKGSLKDLRDVDKASSQVGRPKNTTTDTKRDVGDVDNDSRQVEKPKNTIIERKQQRDAIDALLSSALISSRKPVSSRKSLPVKRNLSSISTEGHATRPPKSRKGS